MTKPMKCRCGKRPSVDRLSPGRRDGLWQVACWCYRHTYASTRTEAVRMWNAATKAKEKP